MKRKFKILLLFILFLSAQTVTVKAQNTNISNDSIRKLANVGLERYLKILKNSNVKDYGFNTIEDLSEIKIGNPIQIFRFNRSFYEDTILKDDDCIFSINEYRVPLIVDDTICSFIKIAYFEKHWQVVGYGGNLLADNIMQCIQKFKIDNSKDLILLHEPLTYSGFLISGYFDKENEPTYFPAMSNLHIMKNDFPDKKMTKKELMPLIHQKCHSSKQTKKINP